MPNEPLYYATEDTFVCGARWYQLVASSDAEDIATFEAMKQWCRDHDIDPATVAAAYPIIRREDGVKYFRINKAGKAVAWGVPTEGDPKPWPDVIEVTGAEREPTRSAAWWRTAIGANAAEQAQFEELGVEAAQMGLTPEQARSLFMKWARGEIEA